jgi:hypothetical protein
MKYFDFRKKTIYEKIFEKNVVLGTKYCNSFQLVYFLFFFCNFC